MRKRLKIDPHIVEAGLNSCCPKDVLHQCLFEFFGVVSRHDFFSLCRAKKKLARDGVVLSSPRKPLLPPECSKELIAKLVPLHVMWSLDEAAASKHVREACTTLSKGRCCVGSRYSDRLYSSNLPTRPPSAPCVCHVAQPTRRRRVQLRICTEFLRKNARTIRPHRRRASESRRGTRR